MILPYPNKLIHTRLQILLLAIASILSWERPNALADDALQRAVDGLQQRYETLQDLEADFVQITRFKGFETSITSKGKMYLKKGKFRWDYLQPEGEQIFMDGDRIMLYVPEHRQVIKTRLDTEFYSQVPVRLLAGGARIRQDFTIRWKDEKNPRTPKGDYLLMLQPKKPAAGFTEIEMAVDASRHIIRRLRLTEPGGNSSDIEFSNARINAGLKDRIFDFKIPEGVVVVDQP